MFRDFSPGLATIVRDASTALSHPENAEFLTYSKDSKPMHSSYMHQRRSRMVPEKFGEKHKGHEEGRSTTIDSPSSSRADQHH